MSNDATHGLSTGVELLDSALGGGVRPRSLIALSAPPRAQSEPLLYAMAVVNPTRYISTLRPATEVRDAITAGTDSSIETVDINGVDGDDILDHPETYLEGLDHHSVVIIDPTTEVEQGDRERYRNFLDVCKRALRMTDSVGLFHCHENTPSVLRRDMTLARADQVWDVRVTIENDEVRTRLGVTKCRSGAPFGLVDLTFDTNDHVAATPRRDT